MDSTARAMIILDFSIDSSVRFAAALNFSIDSSVRFADSFMASSARFVVAFASSRTVFDRDRATKHFSDGNDGGI
jgi:hypothetical protein